MHKEAAIACLFSLLIYEVNDINERKKEIIIIDNKSSTEINTIDDCYK